MSLATEVIALHDKARDDWDHITPGDVSMLGKMVATDSNQAWEAIRLIAERVDALGLPTEIPSES